MTEKLKETDVLKAMNELPEEWLESCYKEKEKDGRIIPFGKSGKAVGRWAVAASIVLLLCGGVCLTAWGWNRVYASKKTEFQAYAEKLGIYEPGEYPFRTAKDRNAMGEETNSVHYYLLAEAKRVTQEELTGQIQEVKEDLSKQLAETDYSRRWDYPKWSKKFGTVKEAKDYIGYGGLKETKTWGKVDNVYINVVGDKKGNIAELMMSVGYTYREEDTEFLIAETVEVFTEESQSTLHHVGAAMQDVYGWGESFRKEEYTNANGKTAAIVYEERENEKKGERFLHGVIVEEAVCYELIVWYSPEDIEQAEEIMYEWCEQF